MRKVVAEARDPDRHDRQAPHGRSQLSEFADRAVKLGTVVDAAAKDDLPVHLDARVRKPFQLFHNIAREPVAQHHAPKGRVGRMHGDIDRFHAKPDDAVDVPLFHISECYVIALQK